MCLAVPLKLIEINGKTATGEAMGMTRQLRVDFIKDPQVGDYVMVHAGIAIAKITEEDQSETDRIMESLQEAL